MIFNTLFSYNRSLTRNVALGFLVTILVSFYGFFYTDSNTFNMQGIQSIVPTWQSVLKLIYQKQITSAVLERYVRQRIDMRIAYYRNLLKKETLTQQERDAIPPCVRDNISVTSYDLVAKAFVYSDPEAKKFYNESINTHGSIDSWEQLMRDSGGFCANVGEKIYLFMEDNLEKFENQAPLMRAYQMLIKIEHEITHTFQYANGRLVTEHYTLEKPITLMTNLDTHKTLKRENRNACEASSNWAVEREADQGMATFCPNAAMLEKLFDYLINDCKFTGLERAQYGYLPYADVVAYSKENHYIGKNDSAEFEKIAQQLRTPNSKITYILEWYNNVMDACGAGNVLNSLRTTVAEGV